MAIHWDMRSVLEATSQRAVIFTVATSCQLAPPISTLEFCLPWSCAGPLKTASAGSWNMQCAYQPQKFAFKALFPMKCLLNFFCLFFIEVIWVLIFKCCIISKSPRVNERYFKLWNSYLSQWRNTLDCVSVTEETEWSTKFVLLSFLTNKNDL